MPVSPCTKVCQLNPASDLCRGCGRTLAEIAAWGRMPETEQARIMALLPDRIAKAEVPAQSGTA
jgi:uncharacterized protein